MTERDCKADWAVRRIHYNKMREHGNRYLMARTKGISIIDL